MYKALSYLQLDVDVSVFHHVLIHIKIPTNSLPNTAAMLTAGKTNIGWVCLDELVRERRPRQQAPRRLIFMSFNLHPTVSLGVSSIRGCGRATKREGCR